jgi:hypothetical protein
MWNYSLISGDSQSWCRNWSMSRTTSSSGRHYKSSLNKLILILTLLPTFLSRKKSRPQYRLHSSDGSPEQFVFILNTSISKVADCVCHVPTYLQVLPCHDFNFKKCRILGIWTIFLISLLRNYVGFLLLALVSPVILRNFFFMKHGPV